MDRWITDSQRWDRLPYYTRANAGEVLPDPCSPLGWSLVFEQGLLKGWLRGFVEFGVYAEGELPDDPPPVAGLFGGYFYLNLSHMRLMGLRMGMTVEQFDAALLGSHPDAPPYEPHPDDLDPACSERSAATIGDVLQRTEFQEIDEDALRVRALRRDRPDLSALTEAQLVAHARSFLGELDNAFARHDYSSLASTVGQAMVAQLCADAGRPELLLDLISGLGDVESASPSSGLWDLSRTVNGSEELSALFDQGAAAVAAALPGAEGGDLAHLRWAFDGFLSEYGMRGPNEWDVRARSWDADPVQALAHVDTLRHSADDGSPTSRAERLTARRRAAAEELQQAIGGDEAKLATLELGLRSAKDTIPLREQTKANAVVVVNEVRLALRELGRRGVEAGRLSEPEDVMMLLADELDRYVADPAAFTDVIVERLAGYRSLFEVEPPFIIAADLPPLTQWKRRARDREAAAAEGTVLTGVGGSAGSYTGPARVIKDLADAVALEPGDVLVAPLTDAAWTPLFLVAGAVVVDMGALNSHAVVVSREVGLPCVLSVTGATAVLTDGMLLTVDGTAGTVTVAAVPALTG
ncbi:MAG: pigC [Frankiales bacterium]|nr:pigC [Frankiales bacterium]